MASIKLRLPYQKLQKPPPELDGGFAAEEEDLQRRGSRAAGGGDRRRWQLRLGGRRGRRWWRRPRVRILPLRRLLGRRARLVRASLGRVVRRFREGRSHLGEIFAGNYLFVQVTPAPVRPCLGEKPPQAVGRGLAPPPSWYCLPGVA
ncbi:hypothetical protein Taro_034501 [Colocasia esculenta]|uniref:Uncharacterized protein n=1 Tax=Colocasia esculenta TaxID=4460 RepID=A0A843VWK9_COLES|nr:hypothetical protein [Colocasia esculenta]